VLRYQEKPRRLGAGNVEAAGFRYHLLSPGPSTGSMTTAGLSSLCIARAGARKLPADLAREVETALQHGRAWLGANYDVGDNPGFAGQRWAYYLYGLERASVLLEVATWDGHPWYLDGARVLLERQSAQGTWGPDNESDTCFGILFLARATAPATGKPRRGPRSVPSEDPTADLAFKVIGDDDGSPLTLLLTRVGAADGTRTYAVDATEYLVDDEVIAAVPGDGRAWTQHTDCSARWQAKAPGTYTVNARVTARRIGSDGKAVGEAVHLEGRPAQVVVREALAPWMLAHASWKRRNQLVRGEVAASASSELDPGRRAERAVDGHEGSAWVCGKDDPAPRLVLQCSRPVGARTLVLTQANGARGRLRHFDLVRSVQVYVNGAKSPITADLDADELTPTRIDLGKLLRIRRLEIAVVARDGGRTERGAAGFAEVALER
jgi:hypothetical protein